MTRPRCGLARPRPSEGSRCRPTCRKSSFSCEAAATRGCSSSIRSPTSATPTSSFARRSAGCTRSPSAATWRSWLRPPQELAQCPQQAQAVGRSAGGKRPLRAERAGRSARSVAAVSGAGADEFLPRAKLAAVPDWRRQSRVGEPLATPPVYSRLSEAAQEKVTLLMEAKECLWKTLAAGDTTASRRSSR